MTRASTGIALCFLMAAVALGCGRVTLELPPTDTGGVSGRGGVSGGSGGGGGQGLGGATGPGGAGGGAVDCLALDEASCRAHATACRTDECTICGSARFERCSPFDAAKPVCIIPPCLPPPVPCGQVGGLAECELRPDCHSVFKDLTLTCDCATPGCCISFAFCAAGDKAVCTPPPTLCKSLAPYCGPGFTLAYAAACFEGCVAPADCAEPKPSPPAP